MTAVILEKPSIHNLSNSKHQNGFKIRNFVSIGIPLPPGIVKIFQNGYISINIKITTQEKYFQISHCYEVVSVPSAMIPLSPSIFYDDSGNPILSSCYPYYNFYSFRPPSSLVDDYNVNQQLSLDSAIYNVPLSDLYQLYNLIENNMPNLPTNMELSMMQDLAKAIQDEKARQYLNPYQYKLDPQSNPSVSCKPASLISFQYHSHRDCDVFIVSFGPTDGLYAFGFTTCLRIHA